MLCIISSLSQQICRKNIFLKEQAMIINVTCSSSFLWLDAGEKQGKLSRNGTLEVDKILFYGFLIYTNNLFTSFFFGEAK